MSEQNKVVGCAWMLIKDANITTCGDLPSTKAKNGSYYCQFHFPVGNTLEAFEIPDDSEEEKSGETQNKVPPPKQNERTK